MNYMDAVEILSVITTDAAQRLTSTEMDDAIAEATRALEATPEYERLKERDRAKKPIIDGAVGMGGDEIRCPSCGWAIGEKQKYCDGCGQRIDWSEEVTHED